MAGLTAQGTTASFNGTSFTVTGFSFEPPAAILTDMTAAGDLVGARKMAPTGEKTPGTFTVDFLAGNSFGNPQDLSGVQSKLSISGPYTLSRNVVCTGGTVQASVGDLVRGTLQFTITDWYG